MKYRRLSLAELKQLEPEFIKFLAANTITGADWEKLKEAEPARAEGLIELFSDLVMEKTLENVSFLEFRTAKEVRCFFCGPAKIVLCGLSTPRIEGFSFEDLSGNNSLQDLLSSGQVQLETYRTEKGYQKERNLEIFSMLQSGCMISDGQLFKTLETMNQA
ncbi:MAG: hypothetical protein HKN16_00235 [Saprospiraceae bacterium]|nr:hypothetical protein [Saprospiraceae bacterium]